MIRQPGQFAAIAISIFPAAAVNKHNEGRVFDSLWKMKIEQEFHSIRFCKDNVLFDLDLMFFDLRL
jgi:hypothetical protein